MVNPRIYDPNEDISAQADAARQEWGSSGSEAAVEALVTAQAGVLASVAKSGKRAFVFPNHVNFKALLRAGVLNQIRDANAPLGVRDMSRTGDIFLKVTGGMCVFDPSTEDGALQLAYCEAHPEMCRDAMAPETEVWAEMKRGQAQLVNKEPSIPQNLDIDKIMAGDFSGFAKAGSLTARARQLLANQAQG